MELINLFIRLSQVKNIDFYIPKEIQLYLVLFLLYCIHVCLIKQRELLEYQRELLQHS